MGIGKLKSGLCRSVLRAGYGPQRQEHCSIGIYINFEFFRGVENKLDLIQGRIKFEEDGTLRVMERWQGMGQDRKVLKNWGLVHAAKRNIF